MKTNLLLKARKSLGIAVAVTLIGSACPVVAQQVTLLQSDPSGTFSFNSGANWSDSLAPSAGKTYSVTGTSDTIFTLRAPQTATFAGDSLSINNRGSLAWAPPGSTGTPTGTLTIDNFILNGGSIANFRTGGTLILAGNISVTAESTLQIGSTVNTTARNMTLNAPITGSSRLRVSAAGTGSNVLTVNGNNSNFSGGFELLNGSGSNNTITVGHANALGTGTTTVTQGILNLNGLDVSVGGLAGANASNSFVQNNSATAAVLNVISSADTSYAGVIRNGTGNVALAKSGTANLALSGANNYTGTTTITAGTLALGANNVLPDASNVSLGAGTLDAATFDDTVGTLDVTGAATINLGSGAQLTFADSSAGGTAIWAGTLTLTGTFVPGNGVDPGVGTNPGSLRFATGTGLTAAQLAKISATGWTAFALDAFGYLTATPTGDNTAPYISDVANQTIPSDGSTGALAITVGDTETPVGSLTLSVSGNSNPTLVPNGNVVFGGSDANRTVTVTPVSGLSGSATLTIRVTDGGGLFTEDSFTVTVQSPYESWAGGAGFNADANNDGISNGLAFLLGASGPSDAVTKPTVTETDGDLTLTFSMRNAASRGPATLHLEHSRDVGTNDTWASLLVPDTTPDPQATDVEFIITPGSPLNGVTATIQASEAGGTGKLFGRLKAMNP